MCFNVVRLRYYANLAKCACARILCELSGFLCFWFVCLFFSKSAHFQINFNFNFCNTRYLDLILAWNHLFLSHHLFGPVWNFWRICFSRKSKLFIVYNSLFIVAALIFVPLLTFMFTLYLIHLSLRTKQKMTVVSLEMSQCLQVCTIYTL